MNYLFLLIVTFCSFTANATAFKDLHFVLVGGLNNELVPTYFKSFEDTLRSRGSDHVDRLLPTSYQTVMENVPKLKADLERLFIAGGSRPMVIVAHSKGGLELLHVMLRHFGDFFPEKVRLLVFSNVPFQGSPYMKVAIKKLESPLYTYNPVIQQQLRALRSLETNVILSDLEQSFAVIDPSAKKDLSQKVFYIRTSEVSSEVNFTLKESANYLKDSPNDGLIPLANQRISSFGNDLTVETSTDHTDLFVGLADPYQMSKLEKILNLVTDKAN